VQVYFLLTPSSDCRLDEWWLQSRKMVVKDPFVVLIAWLLWRERNDRIFNEAEVGLQWIVAGFAPLSDML
jgi:hypothetical protein